MKTAKIVGKFIVLPICLIFIFNFLEYGLSWDKTHKFLYPIGLSIITLISIHASSSRRIFLTFSFGALALMVVLYLVGQLELSNIIGSTGLAVLIISLISYLPQLIKKGFVEKF